MSQSYLATLFSPFSVCYSASESCLLFAADTLMKALRRLIVETEKFESRPCMSFDVCSDRQAHLVANVGCFADVYEAPCFGP